MNKLLLALLGLAIFPSLTFAAGIQVSPASLNFVLEKNSQTSQTVYVVNPTADVQIFEIYADDFKDSLKPSISSFTLESGEKKSVEITVNSKTLNIEKNSIINTNISVVSKPLAAEKFTLGTGVKIPSTITIKEGAPASPLKHLPKFIGIILILAISIWIFKKHKK